jgi:hypothetical protein
MGTKTINGETTNVQNQFSENMAKQLEEPEDSFPYKGDD